MRLITMCIALLAICAIDVGAVGHVATGASPDWLLYLGGGLLVFGAALGAGNLTLMDVAKRTDPTGRMSAITEQLNQTNEFLDDATFIEGNLPTGNQTTVRTSLPTATFRRMNQGVTPSKSTTAQIDDQSANLEAWSEVDVAVLKLNGNTAAARLSEGRPFIEAMNQTMTQTFFYGNGGLDPEQFTGFAPRYNLSTAPNGQNVIKAGSVDTDNTSIFLVAWHPETVSGLYPKGSVGGLEHNDYGEVTVETVAGLPGQRMRAMQERWVWQAGLMVKDWRYVVRICNIDVSLLNGATPPDLISLMEQAEESLPGTLGRRVFYMNRTVRRNLRRIQRLAVGTGGGTTMENYEGKRVLMFGTTPIRTVDAIINTEALVS